jgi:hypothetical protein
MMALLAGCGGGSGGDESAGTQISTNAISFTANRPDAATPASQVFTATFGSDIAHLAVVHSGSAVNTVTSTLNGRTATITVEPAAPSTVGPGAFVGAVAVTGYTCADATCSKLAAGTTATVSVNYQVSPIVQLVTPYVETAGVADDVIIRGLGLNAFSVQSVRFGDVAATAFTSINSTEIRATHPALPAGSYPVRLVASNFQGDITTTATLVVVDPTAFTATTLPYPSPLTSVRRLIYDAERRALLVVTDAGGGSIVRYPSTGTSSWGAPTQLTAGLNDAALSAKGTSLYAIAATSLVPLDPVTLALGTSIAAPSLVANSFLKNIVVGDDDVGLITTGFNGSTPTTAYFYFPLSSTVLAGSGAFNNATPAMAANGTGAYLMQGDPSLTADVVAAKYTTSGNTFSNALTTLRQNTFAPVISRTGNRLILNGAKVLDSAESVLGMLPASTTALVLKPDGTRAYTYDSAAGGILVYDVSVDLKGAAYAPLGAVVPLAGDPGSNPKMIISPDARTLFLAGGTQVVVQPSPAL